MFASLPGPGWAPAWSGRLGPGEPADFGGLLRWLARGRDRGEPEPKARVETLEEGARLTVGELGPDAPPILDAELVRAVEGEEALARVRLTVPRGREGAPVSSRREARWTPELADLAAGGALLLVFDLLVFEEGSEGADRAIPVEIGTAPEFPRWRGPPCRPPGSGDAGGGAEAARTEEPRPRGGEPHPAAPWGPRPGAPVALRLRPRPGPRGGHRAHGDGGSRDRPLRPIGASKAHREETGGSFLSASRRKLPSIPQKALVMERRMPRHAAALGALALALLASGCTSTRGSSTKNVVDGSSPWIQPSPILEQQIEDEAQRLPWTHGFERLEQIRWFASVGEPAYVKLLELAEDERDDVAAAALAALGATMDRRLVPHIQAIRWSEERSMGDLRLERARTLVRLGDWSQIPVLVRGLGDERLYTRSLCLDALKEATRETHGFDPHATEEERGRAMLRWNDWWLARSGEGILN